MSAKDKIKQAWDENPIQVMLVAAGLLTGVAKFIDAISGIQSKRAYARRSRRRK